MTEMLLAALDNVAAYIAFFFVLLGFFCFSMVAAMLALLALLTGWRWLRRATWNYTLVSLERRALRQMVKG